MTSCTEHGFPLGPPELRKAQVGDAEATERFMKAIQAYSKQTVPTYVAQGYEAQTAADACFYGLLEALRAWDSNGEKTFSDFAEPYIKKRLG